MREFWAAWRTFLTLFVVALVAAPKDGAGCQEVSVRASGRNQTLSRRRMGRDSIFPSGHYGYALSFSGLWKFLARDEQVENAGMGGETDGCIETRVTRHPGVLPMMNPGRHFVPPLLPAVASTLAPFAPEVVAQNQVRYADQFAGANAGARIQAAIADLHGAPGVVYATALSGSQNLASMTIAANNVTLVLGAGTYNTVGITVTGLAFHLVAQGPQNTNLHLVSPGTFAIKVVNERGDSVHFTSSGIYELFKITTSVIDVPVKGIFLDNADASVFFHVISDLEANTAVRSYALHGRFMQNTSFYTCVFTSGSGKGSDGVLLESIDVSNRSNNNLFFACRFQSSGGWGVHNLMGEANNFYGCSFQDNGLGGFLDDNLNGNGGRSTLIEGGWFEVNSGDSVQVNIATNAMILNSIFPEGSTTNAINVKYCDGCIFQNNFSYNSKPVLFVAGHDNKWINNTGFGPITDTSRSLFVQNGGTFRSPIVIGDGSAIRGYESLSANIEPSSVAPKACAEQIFTPPEFSPLTASDNIYINFVRPDMTLTTVKGWRAVEGGIGITYCNFTATPVTPVTQTVRVTAWK